MEFLDLLKALGEAKGAKAFLALLGYYFFDLVAPAIEFIVLGVLVVAFQVVTSIAKNIKAQKLLTADAQLVVFKLFLYPGSILVVAIVQSRWAPVLPLIEVTSGYIIVHELEKSMGNVSYITGWNLTGPVDLLKKFTRSRWIDKNGSDKNSK